MISNRRAAALEALTSPVRQELMSHLGDGPATVTEIARRLGRTRQSLYYHVVALERAGLIRHIETRGEGRTAERVYAANPAGTQAKSLNVRERAAAQRAIAAMLRLTQREVVAATHRSVSLPAAAPGSVMAVRAKARLDPATVARVRALVGQLIETFRSAKGRHHEEPPFALTLVLTPARESGVAGGGKGRHGTRSAS